MNIVRNRAWDEFEHVDPTGLRLNGHLYDDGSMTIALSDGAHGYTMYLPAEERAVLAHELARQLAPEPSPSPVGPDDAALGRIAYESASRRGKFRSWEELSNPELSWGRDEQEVWIASANAVAAAVRPPEPPTGMDDEALGRLAFEAGEAWLIEHGKPSGIAWEDLIDQGLFITLGRTFAAAVKAPGTATGEDAEALGRLAWETRTGVACDPNGWAGLKHSARERNIAAAKAVANAVRPPGTVCVDREVVEVSVGWFNWVERELAEGEQEAYDALTAALATEDGRE